MKTRGAVALFFLFLYHFVQGALAEQPVPALVSPVTDLTQTLTTSEQQQLEALLRDFEQRKGSQIAVVIVTTTKPEEIEQFAIRVAEAW